MEYYVYCWTNLVNGKQYIGKGARDRYKHHSKPSMKSLLSAAFRKYGEGSFGFRFLAAGLDEALAFALEEAAIVSYDTRAPQGYNRTAGGKGCPGMAWSPESLIRLSQGVSGKQRTPESIERYRKASLLREAARRLLPPDQRKKPAESVLRGAAKHVGQKRSAETRRKMSEAAKAREARKRATATSNV